MKQKLKTYIQQYTTLKPILNFYKTDYKKKILISYIVNPFKKEIAPTHSNKIEALEITKIFHDLSFQVDIYDFRHKLKVDFEQYDVIFGIGQLYERAVQNKLNNIVYISYATGAYFCWANYAEIDRLKKLYDRKGKMLKPRRFVSEPTYFASQVSDGMIVIGNDWTVSTYINSKMPICKQPVSVYHIPWIDDIRRDIDKSKKNFLWIGSAGLIHKGLDVCLEVFKNTSDLNLYVCGPKEEDFFELYKKELNLKNIHYKGFVNIQSQEFKGIVEKCSFVLYPSCSEGMSGALLTAMSTGLIPLATKQSGVDLDFGFEVTDSMDDIKNKVLHVSTLDDEELNTLSQKNTKQVSEKHNIENFKTVFKENITKILKESNNG